MGEIPTLCEWAGGPEAIEALFEEFYRRVAEHPELRVVFQDMPVDHHAIVAKFVTEVLGGPDTYSQGGGSHRRMIQKHLGRHLTDSLRKAWMNLLLEAADDLGLPPDPDFRSALVGYLEWGSRIAVINSALEPSAAVEPKPMPTWGWGEPKGPYKSS